MSGLFPFFSSRSSAAVVTSIPRLLSEGSRNAGSFAQRAPRLPLRIGPRSLRERAAIVGIVSVVVVGVLIMTLTGSAVAAGLPALGAIFVAAVWTQPLRRTLIPVIFIQCVVFAPPYHSGKLWTQILEPASRYLNGRLSVETGIGFLAISGQELIYLFLLGLLCLRALRGQRIDAAGRSPSANVLLALLAVSLVTVFALFLWGMVTGGTVKATLFQIRSVIWLPVWTVLLSFALRDSKDFRVIGLTITYAALVKIGLGLFFITQDAWNLDIEPAYMTSHEDSVLYVSLLVIWLAAWLHEGTWQRLVTMCMVVGCMGFAIVVNNRRLAYVNLVGSLLAYYPLLAGRTKRKIKIALLLASPLFATYLLIARTKSDGIFAPGAVLMGIAKTADPSTQWRVLENQNLIYTIRENRFLGRGFGKEWDEVIKLPDVSIAFKEYRLIGHNSVLWLLGVAGMFGFALIWMPIVAGVYLATRSYHFATTDQQRTAAVAVVVVSVCYVSQAWGDIGLGSSLTTILMALALALAGKLARETGAWTADSRIV